MMWEDNKGGTIIIIIILDKRQQNSKLKLCGDRIETTNQISDSSKLAQK